VERTDAAGLADVHASDAPIPMQGESNNGLRRCADIDIDILRSPPARHHVSQDLRVRAELIAERRVLPEPHLAGSLNREHFAAQLPTGIGVKLVGTFLLLLAKLIGLNVFLLCITLRVAAL